MSKARQNKAWTAAGFRKADVRLRTTELEIDGEAGTVFYVPPSVKSITDLAKLEEGADPNSIRKIAEILAKSLKAKNGSQLMSVSAWMELAPDTLMAALQAIAGATGGNDSTASADSNTD